MCDICLWQLLGGISGTSCVFKKWRFFLLFIGISGLLCISKKWHFSKDFLHSSQKWRFFKRNKNGVIKMALTIRKLYYTI